MQINKRYLLIFIILLVTEILIALFVHDAIIRPFIGDVLVIILMYTFIRGLFRKTIKFLAVYLFFFASAVEVAQYIHIVKLLHLQNNKVMSTIIGTSYDVKDILCYLIATVTLVIWELVERRSMKY